MKVNEIKSILETTNVVSGDGGRVTLTSQERQDFVILANGKMYCSLGRMHDAEARAVIRKAKEAGLTVSETIEVISSVIAELYVHSSPDDDVYVDDDLSERQMGMRDILQSAASLGATDVRVLITPDVTQIKVRVHGRLMDHQSRSRDEGMKLILATFNASAMNKTPSPTDYAEGVVDSKNSVIVPDSVEKIRLQYNYGPDGRGAMVMRLIYKRIGMDADVLKLGYSKEQAEMLEEMRRRTNGANTFAGKVSSGKTRTLQANMDLLMSEKHGELSLFTAESPIELALPDAIQVPVEEAKGGFSGALVAALRSDVNVLLLGETRTDETAQMAMRVVLTGHALWTTVHAASALGILDRYLDLGVPPWQLTTADSMRGLIYQRLVGVLCPHCKVPFPQALAQGLLRQDLHNDLVEIFEKEPETLFVRGNDSHRTEKCTCTSGLIGRTVAAEVCLADQKLLQLYVGGDREGALNYWITPKKDGGLGGIPVLHHAFMKCGAGEVCPNEVEEEVGFAREYKQRFMPLQKRMAREVWEYEQTIPEARRPAPRPEPEHWNL